MRAMLAFAVLAVAAGPIRADEPSAPLARAEIEKKLRRVAYDVALKGTELFNDGRHESCYRLFEGALTGMLPLLDHKPDLAAAIRERMYQARSLGTPAEQAFELRKALDAVMGVGPAITKKPLWDRLGGEKAVEAVVRDFVAAAIANPKANLSRNGKYRFDAEATARLERLLVEFVSQGAGGPLKYTGRDMKASHEGMRITEEEFTAVMADLTAALRKNKIPPQEALELAAMAASTRELIVEVRR